MLDAMNAEDLMLWMEYAELEPFGEERADLRSGMSAVGICARLQAKGRVKLEEFMPKFRPRKNGRGNRHSRPGQEQLTKKLLSAFGAINHYHNASSK